MRELSAFFGSISNVPHVDLFLVLVGVQSSMFPAFLLKGDEVTLSN